MSKEQARIFNRIENRKEIGQYQFVASAVIALASAIGVGDQLLHHPQGGVLAALYTALAIGSGLHAKKSYTSAQASSAQLAALAAPGYR